MGTEVFTLTVDYTRPLMHMISAGKYGQVDDHITQNNFPHQSTGVVERECRLFLFNRETSSRDIVAEMKEDGFEPADMATLCAFGEKFPDKQLQVSITALGQVGRNADAANAVGFLGLFSLDNPRRSLFLDHVDSGTNGSCRHRFLAVRKTP